MSHLEGRVVQRRGRWRASFSREIVCWCADDGSLEIVDRKKDNSEKGGGVDKCESLRPWEEKTFSILQYKSEPTQRSAGNQYL